MNCFWVLDICRYIYLEDLLRFLPEQDALKTLNAVEGSNEAEKISKASLKSWVVNILFISLLHNKLINHL